MFAMSVRSSVHRGGGYGVVKLPKLHRFSIFMCFDVFLTLSAGIGKFAKKKIEVGWVVMGTNLCFPPIPQPLFPQQLT